MFGYAARMPENKPASAERVTMNIVRDGNGDFGQRGQQPVATTPMPAIAQSSAPAAPPSAPGNLTGVATPQASGD